MTIQQQYEQCCYDITFIQKYDITFINDTTKSPEDYYPPHFSPETFNNYTKTVLKEEEFDKKFEENFGYEELYRFRREYDIYTTTMNKKLSKFDHLGSCDEERNLENIKTYCELRLALKEKSYTDYMKAAYDI